MNDQIEEDANLEAAEADRRDPQFWHGLLGGDATADDILQDRNVSEAIRSGRMQALYELLRKRSRSPQSTHEGEALEGVLAHRRWFVEEAAAPGMNTFNGIGTSLHGSAEREADGSYIAKLFFTIFFVPIWPIREYLVQRAESRGWYFFGRVPMSGGSRWMRRLVLGSVLALAVGISYKAWNRQTHDDVSFLNGLEFAVTVEMGGQRIEVPPEGRLEREFSAGDYHVVARDPEGVVIEERDVTVPGGHDVVVYSVLGAAPLVSHRVGYGADDTAPARVEAATSWKSLAGQSWFQREDVDFVWDPVPESIETGKRTKVEVRTQILVSEGGWRAAAAQLSNRGDDGGAAELARRVATLRPTDVNAMAFAHHYALVADDVPAARALVEQTIKAAPDSIEAHRHYQGHFEGQGESATILPRYRDAYEREPDSARHGYLLARMLPMAEAAPIYSRLVALHPEDPWIRRGAAWVDFHRGNWAAATSHCTKAMELQPEEAGWFAIRGARAAAADGRADAGLKMLERVLDGVPARSKAGQDGYAGGDPWTLIHTYGCLRAQTGAGASYPALPDVIKPFLSDAAVRADLLARIAAFRRDRAAFERGKSKIKDSLDARACELVLLSRENLAEAARRVRTTDADALPGLDDVARLLIACELLHDGHDTHAKAAFDALSPEGRSVLTFDQLGRLPDLDGLDDDLDVEMRSVLHYVAHLLSTSDEAKAAHLAEARRWDTLGIVVPD